jgi:hypothetical protein
MRETGALLPMAPCGRSSLLAQALLGLGQAIDAGVGVELWLGFRGEVYAMYAFPDKSNYTNRLPFYVKMHTLHTPA